MAKTPQDNMYGSKRKGKLTPKPWRSEYMNLYNGLMSPIDDSYLERFAREFVTWALEQRRPTLTKFRIIKGISKQTVKDWGDRNSNFKELLTLGLEICGTKIEDGLFDRTFSERACMFSLHNYLDEWDHSNKYHNELKTAVSAASAQPVPFTQSNTPNTKVFEDHERKANRDKAE